MDSNPPKRRAGRAGLLFVALAVILAPAQEEKAARASEPKASPRPPVKRLARVGGTVPTISAEPLDHKTFVERTYVNGRLVYEKDKEPLFDHVRRGKVVKPFWKWSQPGE